jgi:orotidine-5'-phosphate decarboxylase
MAIGRLPGWLPEMAEFVEAVISRPPLVLGVDPRPEWHGPEPLPAIERYTLELLEVLGNNLGAVKFQTAFFEAMGPQGFALLHRLIMETQAQQLPVIIDAKRGDIGSTAQAYAQAYLEAFPGSALTVNPYLGSDALEPFVQAAQHTGGALFILVRTSNPGASLFQDLRLETGEYLYQRVAHYLDQLAQTQRVGAWSRIGAVVGATQPDEVAALRYVMPHSLFLLPGLGAQGGQPIAGPGLLNSASRALYYPGGKPDLVSALQVAQQYLDHLKA